MMWWLVIGALCLGFCVGLTVGLLYNAPNYDDFDVLPKYWAPGSDGEGEKDDWHH